MSEQNRDEALKKKVDDAWKAEAAKEKSETGENKAEALEVNFNFFATSLMMQALVALGEVENPITKKKESNKIHAKFMIDTLSMLQDKTRNNLTKEESEMLESILYDLRMRFISIKTP
jgi:hypothetical protein